MIERQEDTAVCACCIRGNRRFQRPVERFQGFLWGHLTLIVGDRRTCHAKDSEWLLAKDSEISKHTHFFLPPTF